MFPVRAGMNRGTEPARQPVENVPRACGDEPSATEQALKLLECSPCVRG